MLGHCSWNIIHIDTETERNSLVETLQTQFQAKLFSALRGHEVVLPGYPLRHPLPHEELTLGMIGCAESHRRVLIEGLFDGTQYVGIFEDDAVFCGKDVKLLDFWIDNCVPSNWDMLCLGVNEIVQPCEKQNDLCVKVSRFWGTHALIVKRETITKLLGMFEQLQHQGIYPVADWWYSYAITQYNLQCYAPANPKAFFVQKEGLVSAITGKVR